jgi:transcriptional regulator with GAF, ATPase, and Fis domain
VVFDCTAVPPNLVESELFGHERGAFTGAVSSRRGVLELAHGGTLLVDEIGDLELPLQPRLLRAIERCEVRRVGAERPFQVDVRVLAATRRNFDVEVQAGRFRDDLFHRLAVARVELPPLRRRKGDVTRLARHFCAELGGDPQALPAELLLRWEDYSWPGNVRELRNAVERHLVFGETMELAMADAEGRALASEPPAAPVERDPGDPDVIDRVLGDELPLVEARKRVVAEFERRYVHHAIERHGSVTRAAAAAGIPRRYFQIIKARTKKE